MHPQSRALEDLIRRWHGSRKDSHGSSNAAAELAELLETPDLSAELQSFTYTTRNGSEVQW